jgi:hypothetical protein
MAGKNPKINADLFAPHNSKSVLINNVPNIFEPSTNSNSKDVNILENSAKLTSLSTVPTNLKPTSSNSNDSQNKTESQANIKVKFLIFEIIEIYFI